MSDLANRNQASSVTESLPGAAELGAQGQSPVRPIKVWAAAGGAILALQLYVWIRWITGPYFERVPTGPSDPPMYMKVPLMANAVVLWVGLPVALWWFIIRPWRRERRITLDGMLVVSMGLMFFQDPLLNYFNTWCTYNTWLCNRGSWSSDIPGWVSPGGTGPSGGRTPPDQRAGLRIRRPADHDRRVLGHAQDQDALARTSAIFG